MRNKPVPDLVEETLDRFVSGKPPTFDKATIDQFIEEPILDVLDTFPIIKRARSLKRACL